MLCVCLQMGWREVSKLYRLNFEQHQKEEGEDGKKADELDSLEWSDVYAPHLADEETPVNLQALINTDMLLKRESKAAFSSSSTNWNSYYNGSRYILETRRVKSMSMSIIENPLVRFRSSPFRCVSSSHLLSALLSPEKLMSTFFPIFHLLESRGAIPYDAIIGLGNDNKHNNSNNDDVSYQSYRKSAEIWNMTAPMIWPFDARYDASYIAVDNFTC